MPVAAICAGVSGEDGLLRRAWNQDFPFFWLLGAGRGGTSLVTAIIGAHSQLAMASEHCCEEILIGRREPWAARSRSERMAGLVIAMIDRAGQEGGVQWGNKITTEALFFGGSDERRHRRDGVDQLLRRVPRVPIVYVLRDGRATVASKMRRAGATLENACRHWVTSIEIWHALGEQGWPMTTVRFEDLVRAPEPTVRTLCRELGVAYEPSMLAATASNLLLPEYRRTRIDAAAAETVDLPPEGMAFIAEAMILAGYH